MADKIRATRRIFLGLLFAILALVTFIPRRVRSKLRPPGALPEDEFERRCIRCFRCAEVCPTNAIRFDFDVDPRVAYTPLIDPSQSACILCMQCTDVCPTAALERLEPKTDVIAERVRMGTPHLDRDLCLTWSRRGNCRLCFTVCPFQESAVKFTLGGPLFFADACVGCGQCEEACPEIAKAIRIRPVRS